MRERTIKALFAAVLLSLTLGIAGCRQQISPPTGNGSASLEDDEQPIAIPGRRGEVELKAFENISIHAQTPDIRLVEGSEYKVSYDLHDMEKAKRIEVDDGVLHFTTTVDAAWKPDGKTHEIVVTVPADAKLDKVTLHSVAGNVTLSGRTVTEASLSSVSGRVEARALTGETLEVRSVSNEAAAVDCRAEEIVGDSTSGAVLLRGEFDRVDAHSVSGRCEISGAVSRKAAAETVSGDILAAFPVENISAKSYGSITLDGEKQDRSFRMEGEGPFADLKSTSGKIEIER